MNGDVEVLGAESYTPPFRVGETAYALEVATDQDECPVCLGGKRYGWVINAFDKQVTAIRVVGHEYPCLECLGEGTVETVKGLAVVPCTVREVRMYDNARLPVPVWEYALEDPSGQMCAGSYYEALLPTQALAEQEIARRAKGASHGK